MGSRIPLFRSSIAWILGVLAGPLLSSAQRSNFDILKGGEVVGSIAASRMEAGDRATYVMTSYSIMDVVWKQVVSTAVTAEYLGGALRACRASIRVNGALRDSSHMIPDGDGHLCYVHPRRSFHRAQAPAWTTSRMYFEEPVDQEWIFVESVLGSCAISATSPGNYVLTFPNGAENRYRYEDGALQEIQVDRTFLDLVFRRKNID